MALPHPCTLGLNRTVLKSLERERRKKGRDREREGGKRERERERERRGGSSQFWPGQLWSKSVVELAE